MDNLSKSLYSRIKEGKISREDALKQMKEFKTSGTLRSTPLSQENSNRYKLETAFNTNDFVGKIQKYLVSKLGKILPDNSRLANLEANLMDLGLESSPLVALILEIEDEANVELNPTLFFEYPNIKELAEFFSRDHHDAFARLLGATKQPQSFEANNKTEVATSLKEGNSSRTTPQGIHTGRTIQISAPSSAGTTAPIKDDIAIIGMHGLFAEAADLNQFWNNLIDKKDVMKEIPIDHWDYRPWYDADRTAKDKTYCKWGSFIDDVDKFDAAFFNISPREAEWMDPQIRLLLQSIYATGEDAGYINQLRGTNTGVFVGVCFHDYADKIAEMNLPVDPYFGTGNSQTVLANRISFIFNLTGPSMAIDTACSSSLFALHHACLAIRNKECDMAFVGGANLLLSSAHYRQYSSIGALSPTGRCHTFDADADGYVPGECVASILLKPLQQAKRDGDHIYAVIKGSAALHGGYTPSLTAPSVVGEENVILKAWEDADVNPETISYFEAHGTGTKLGDPIEIDSIKKAFKRFTNKEHFCAIGSAKANIGHAEGAAGIAGLLKVILQMKNRQIPCLPRFKKLNPYIQLDNSALYINHEVEEWKSPAGVPRRAGISSFGFAGAYAHAVIEEYIPEGLEQHKNFVTAQNPVIIVLSAKKQDRLQAQAERLLNAIRERHFNDNDLTDIAYTLQVREPMEERLGLIVSSIKELDEKLKAFVDDKDGIENMYRGQFKRNQEDLSAFTADEGLQMEIAAGIKNGKYEKLLESWVNGLSFEWNKLYEDIKPRCISLPAYPFARERYWVPVGNVEAALAEAAPIQANGHSPLKQASIHPLLHQNTSNLAEQRFSSTFTGQEFFLTDHVVKGQRVLPGVAYLEMARAAVVASWPLAMSGSATMTSATGIRLKNVVWARPIVVSDRSVQVHIGLFLEEGCTFKEGDASTGGDGNAFFKGEIAYEIYSEPEEDGAELIIHSQGRALLSSIEKTPTLDLADLKAQCNHSIISSDQCYEAFKAMGLEYGPGHQGIKKIYMGSVQLLAELSLPSSVFETRDQFVLHPSLIDAALQTVKSLTMNSSGSIFNSNNLPFKPFMPFALQELEIFDSCTSAMWALVRYCNGSKVEDVVQKFDIDLYDDQGNIRVRMKGIEIQEYEEAFTRKYMEANSTNSLVTKTPDAFEMMTFEEVWQEQNLSTTDLINIKTLVCLVSSPKNQHEIINALSEFDQHINVIFISQSDIYQKKSKQEYDISRTDRTTYIEVFESIRKDYGEIDAMLYLWAFEDPNCISDYSYIVYILQAIAAAKLTLRRFVLAAPFENALERCFLESWIGFERSLGLVLPNTQVSAIILKDKDVIEKWFRKLWTELQVHKVQSVLYQEGKRYVYQVKPTVIQSGDSLLRQGGTYLITGGFGGLGILFAKHFVKTKRVNLILTGRSPIDDVIQSKIKVLEDLGSRVLYIQADVCEMISMKEGMKEAKALFGTIHGVIHAAGIESNQTIFEKDIESFQKVLDPKIKGTLVLDEVLGDEPLDFICYFSSSSAILGDFGSCDYAIGNRFLMAYGDYRNQEQCRGKRQGKTTVINWPLWKDGGMSVGDDENTKMYLKSSGQRFLEAEEGVTVFDKLLSQSNTQHLVLVGELSRIHRFLGLIQDQSSLLSPVISSSSGKGKRKEMRGLSVGQCLEWDLKEHISKILKISRGNLDKEENLANFGFDSISLSQFATVLTEHFGIEITPALFFGHSTIEKLMQYFLTEYQETIQEFYREEIAQQIITHNKAPENIPVIPDKFKPKSKKIRFHNLNEHASGISQSIEPVAIIGMSGRFPEARDIEEMWNILFEGQDVVKEFPKDRLHSNNKEKTQWRCGCIPGISEFDPLFFEISPLEAESMDPRQRLLLQESWRALEDAGYGATQIKSNKIGMFVGVEDGDYQYLTKENTNITSNHNGILAARLAYFLDLHGPVLTINTACSSGLVAAHQACLSLRNGECDTALAAGVNVFITPKMFVEMSKAGMLSEDGKCYTFDKRANGMVPGEAVTVVVLKRLSQAKADGDPVYAVIQGSGINYDGKTNGITAPSGVSQTNLFKEVYNQYNVNPEEIEYIVTHGTGTKLGDPVEINALYDAFKGYTKKQGYCALTSTKTNLGHTLAASGLVSLISLVQALHYETIPTSLHCEHENDYINWQESPFYVNKANKSWPTKNGISQTGDTRMGATRTGAVSAFGMSGTNAHMVVRSYSMEDIGASLEQPPYFLLALSAKTHDALLEKVKNMIEILQNKEFDTQSLLQVSYTLLEGRQHFNHRCAIVIQDRDDAIYTWKRIEDKERLHNLFQGKVPRDFTGTKAIEQYAQDLIKQNCSFYDNQKKYQEILCALADLYCQGYDISWSDMFGETKPKRIHLPTYPFAREHYWISEDDLISGGGVEFACNRSARSTITSTVYSQMLYPLLHQNTSNFYEQRFSSTFTGQEFFLTDHVVKERRVLPGVAYLEMARAAVEQAAGALEEGQTMIRLKNVVWAQPIVVNDQPVLVHIGLSPDESGEITYEVYRESGANSAEVIVHSQGKALLCSVEEKPTLDLSALKAQCSQNIISSSQCYEVFKKMGFAYGPGHQGIKKIYIGSTQILGELSLPLSISETKDQFVLHPSLMDAALQASLMINPDNWNNSNTPLKPALPFALHELEILSNCSPNMWAVIGYSEGARITDSAQKLDIDICDDLGTICVRMKGFSSRVLEGEVGARTGDLSSLSTHGTLMLEPVWKEQAVIEGVRIPDYDQYLTILCEPEVIIPNNFNNQMKEVARANRCLTLQSNQQTIEERFQTYAVQMFEEVQTILNEKPKNNVLIQIVVSTQPQQQLFTGLFGLLKTAQLENLKLIGQLIEIEPGENSAGLIEKLKENSRNHIYNRIRYQGGKRWVADWCEVIGQEEGEAKIPWKDRGIYLITGGAGGLGLIFGKEISERVKDVTLILTGRATLNEEKKAKLEELRLLGARVEYRQVDVTQKKRVIELVEGIKENYGGLHGIIHSAGIIRDNFIIKKTREELQEVLLPKVAGLVNLDLATQDLDLDFFILFSSIAGSLGNPGQADYATANSFMDAYSKYRNTLVTLEQRHGRTLSINWPLWKEGGMNVDEATEKMMLQNLGMSAMRTETGIRALYQSLASGKAQVMVMEGKLSRMRQKILSVTVPPTSTQFSNGFKVSDSATMINTSLFDKLKSALNQVVSKMLKVKTEDIDLDIELREYGFDSILLTQFTNRLNEEFKLELTPAIFFEYPTLNGFIKHLIDEYQALFVSRYEVEIKKPDLSEFTTVPNTCNLLDNVQSALILVVSKLLKVKNEDVDPQSELKEYGFDSILLTQFANKLNEEYKLELTPAVFFEYPTINGFAEYLTQEYQAVFASRFKVQTRVETPVEEHTVQVLEDNGEEISYKGRRRSRFSKIVGLSESKKVSNASEPIAVIGISGIFPGAGDVNKFWNNLLEGKDCITEIPKERWDWRKYYGDPTKEPNKTNIKWGGFIDGIDEFDPLFFGISPKEAELMDPQQRLLMIYVWKAIEDAGYSAQSISGTKTAIFVGAGNSGYHRLICEANIPIEGYTSTGIVPSVGPNRMSYFLNTHGPSEPIETACSSSLVAIHRAVNAMENGSCEMAIVGGVNTIVNPEFHISFNKAGMLCEDGRCKTFSDQANGYVRGEGVGMIFLKKLSAAERDGDHIYGVIRGTAENHGGRANSLTAPNPKAQAELLITAYKKAGIDPRTVTYIEAHGTGTKLGDPVEINGLKAAFKELYQATGDPQVVNSHCGLGSVKTNIGHLELAAGIAGVIKVLLQMKHKVLVKSLHCDTMNQYIELKDSPFYIVRETGEWKTAQDVDGKELPRRAGVSSFGFGGANAHVVIEEYVPKAQECYQITVTPQKPVIIVLSAKNEERLKEQVQQLLTVIVKREFFESNLTDIAYTLQVGREPMEERLALVVGSIRELEEKLKGIATGQDNISDLYRGQVKRNQETIAIFTADEDLHKAIDAWISKGKYAKLLDLWVKGFSFDWNKLYGDIKPHRISLPTYPFASERYWVPKFDFTGINTKPVSNALISSLAISTSIHPLLHRNTSNFAEQRFSSTFTGQEFFLADHIVKEQRVLPGVAYLEMIRAAVERAVEVFEEELTEIRLKNVVWTRPIVVGEQPVQVNIGLFPEDNGEIAYEIYSEPENGYSSNMEVEPILYNQGSAVLSAVKKVPLLDLKTLQAECNQSSLSARQCYELFQTMGFNYGPGHQGIDKVYVGNDQVLAKLTLPASVLDTKDQFVLHPSILDAAIQASVGLLLNTGKMKLSLPFALQELQIISKCASTMWALIRNSNGNASNDKVHKLDIDLCDEQGNICIRMKGFSARVLEGELGTLEPRSSMDTHNLGTLTLEPVWQEQAVAEGISIPNYTLHLMILCEPKDIFRESLETQMNGVAREFRCLTLQSNRENIDECFQKYAVEVFEEIKSILKEKPKENVLIQMVIFAQPEKQLFTGLYGLLKTAQLENPKLNTQLIEVDLREDALGVNSKEIIEKLKENARVFTSGNPIFNQIRYQGGKRYIANWSEVDVFKGESGLSWRDQGVYLITGGAGGLGLIFAKEIARHAKDVTLILTGRSKLDEDKQPKLEELKALGARVDYRQVDVTQKKMVEELIQSIRHDNGSLHGIIHSAGVIRDNYIVNKTKEEFQEVLKPKVTGLVNLDQASQELNLDFFILFSSMAGSLGNPGQADYATANAFMDAYADYRNTLVNSGQRTGHTLSISWPLWKEGGMRVDEETEKMMLQNMGMVAMQTQTGIKALYQSLASGKTQVMVMEGKITRMKQKLLSQLASETPQRKESAATYDSATEFDAGGLLDNVQSALIKTVSKQLKVKVEDIDVHTELNEYGFDSISFTQFANKLNEEYKLELTPAIFFEHPTINSFAKYLIEEYHTVFAPRSAIRIEKDTPELDSEMKTVTSNLLDNVQTALVQTASKLLKVKFEDIDVNTEMNEYGFDSISFTQLANKLNEEFKLELTPAIFFEHSTINGLAKYLTKEYQAVFASRFAERTIIEYVPQFKKDDVKEFPYNQRRNSRLVRKAMLPASEFNISPKSRPEPIAIVGVSCIFPQAFDLNEFWKNLLEGRDCITEIPKDRWDWREYFGDPAKETNKTNIKWGGFIDGVDEFDPLFFGISPKEAELMDPQQRLLMMYAWKALEDAGISAQNLSGTKTGIFVGTGSTGYSGLISRANMAIEGYSSTGIVPSVGPNRMSYFLNIHGPSEPIETACSSSLVAIHRAVSAIENGSCEMAIAGGVNTIVNPELHISFNKAGMLAEDGRCKTFSTQANGYVRGEGAGMIFLKKVKAAEQDGDHIYGVIRGTAENHGGRANSLTAPNPKAQAELLVTAYKNAGIDPRTVTYIEAHGTGTKLGDPIEINGLKTAFKELYQATGDSQVVKSHCGLGSVKTNIGHLELAAGIAGVIKVLLQLKHKTLVKSLHCDTINPYIELKDSPFYIVRETGEWKVIQDAKGNDLPRLAGVSSFGFGGANAHVVIEEYIPWIQEKSQVTITSHNPAIIVLSAKNEERLKEQAHQLLTVIETRRFSDFDLANIAYTLQVGREAMEERLAIIAISTKELEEKLSGFVEGKDGIEGLYRGQVKRNKETVAVFEADEELKEAVNKWIYRKKYAKLLDFWVKGLIVDWNKLNSDVKPRRISLPTYPFVREKYWVSRLDIKVDSAVNSARTEFVPHSQTEKMILIKDWQRKPVETKIDKQSGVLIVLGTISTKRIALELFKDSMDIHVIQVIHDEVPSPDWITTDFYSAKAGELLYQQIKAKQNNQKLLGIIDIAAYDNVYEQSLTIESGKITFLQKLIELNQDEGYKILQATYLLNDFMIEKTTMQGARLAGLYRMLRAEYKQIQAMVMDSDYSIENYKNLIEQIQTEFINEIKENLTECCYRNGERYEPKLTVSHTYRSIQESHNINDNYQEDEVILITGGSRGIGAAIAEDLVLHGVKNLVIMGREELPEPSEWKNFIQYKEKPDLEEKLSRMLSFIERGVRVYYYNTPLTDQNGLKTMLQNIHRDLGPITGVFHCAGLISQNPAFFKKSIIDIETVCEPKIKGLATLDQVLEKEPLSFFILCSSISSIAPTLAAGQSDYAMANAYLDYYAQKQNREGKSYFKSIQWPMWGETGMAAGGTRTPAYKKTGLLPHTTSDGLAFINIIKRTLHPVSLPCVFISGEFIYDHLLKTEIISISKPDLNLSGSSQANNQVLLAKESPADLRTFIVQWLREIFVSELKLPIHLLEEDKSFDEFGVDSIVLAQLTHTMQKRLSKTIDPALLLEHGTIAALTDYFLANFKEAFQKITPETSIKVESIACNIEANPIIKAEPVSSNTHPSLNQPVVINKQTESATDIAIIGLSCRYPDSPNKDAFWDLLTMGVSAIKPVPGERWISKNDSIDYGGWVDGIDLFDPQFFNVTVEDAAIMDPQARLILEESLKAIYDAGYEHKQLAGERTGVYIGGRLQPNLDMNAILKAPNPILGTGQNYLATNISRFFNFKGPSLVVDTACSSGITGMLFAADSLRERRIDMALVGAINLMLSTFAHDMFAARNILNKNGEFHIFDKRSNGEVLGEGVGVVILKRLSDAIRDGNQIYGVIKAIAVNNDGRTLGPGSPNINAQKQVIQEALMLSGRQPEDIGYIEVNGGGSPVVDSIEIKALSEVYQLGNQTLGSCSLGTVKPNIGHSLLASGLAGFIRCVLSVYKKQIPPFLSALEPFTYYDFSTSRIRFDRETTDWKVDAGKKRITAQNSFPDGGTNCHILVEEFVPDGSYRQQYFPKNVPNMVKKCFPLSLLSFSVSGISNSEEHEGIDIDKKQLTQEIKRQYQVSIQNIWGDFDEKNL